MASPVPPPSAESGPARTAVSDTFDPAAWRDAAADVDRGRGGSDGPGLPDLTYHRHVRDGADQPVVRIAFDRPEVRNAFRPHTVD